ncbi:hypothetical protein FNV43_RR24478 [Rhamnella rubrinervis]|uniref:Pentatricopeptide repeat-containing protein-mitochondrial domain-containing protein n=1 Tax=Rhamnella rubrinervis TaxID=2594499 RepID=A0A8K0GQ99_9ROSA|nr:hypothetical protein FNV43_RR24478 [Rhamnella rubrinervis]
MLLLRKFPLKLLNTPPTLAIPIRLSTAANLNPSPDPFPDEPTSAYYDGLVHAAGRSRDFETLRHLLNKRVSDGCFTTSKTFNFLTNTEGSLSMLDDLSHTLSRLERGFTRKSAYDSLISRLCKLDRIDDSLRLVDAMARGGFGLNSCSFHAILNALTRKKRMDEAWHVMGIMKTLGVSPDLTAYNYFLMTYCYTGDLAMAAQVLRMMEEESMKADTRTYDALVLGACRTGKVEGALVLLRRMDDDGLPMLLSTRNYVIDALLSVGWYDQAMKFVRIYSGKDTWLDTETFGCLANRLIKLNRLNEAMEVLEEMKRMGLVMGDKLKQFYQTNLIKQT